MSSADNLCKQIGPGKHQAWLGSNLFDTQMVFIKDFFEKIHFDKNQQTTKRHEKFPRGQIVNIEFTQMFCLFV